MAGADVDLQPDTGIYTVRLAQVVDAETARAVLAGLKAAFAHWRSDENRASYFEHRIEVGNLSAEGLPVDQSALHEDFRAGGHSHAEGISGLQPGWFWRHTAELPGGADVVREWLAFAREACSTAAADHQDLWENGDAGIALGESAALTLALQDPAWLGDYTAMLEHWDLGHEVHTLTGIHAMFLKHGWSPAMADLMLKRVATDGQHGTQQVFRDLRPALEAQLPAQAASDFYTKALTVFRAANLSWLAWPPDENAFRTFDIDDTLLAIAQTLPANVVEAR